MPTYESPGTANLRADPQVYTSPGDKSPSMSGKDAGGDATNAKTLSGGSKSTPSGQGSTPKGVQTYDEDAT